MHEKLGRSGEGLSIGIYVRVPVHTLTRELVLCTDLYPIKPEIFFGLSTNFTIYIFMKYIRTQNIFVWLVIWRKTEKHRSSS